ncbi:MAG: choice-of-anchor J domain-containing protein, partial [Candidatus Syntrophosphaera sp.]
TMTDWSNTTAGTANNNFCSLKADVYPADGLTFEFSPPATGEPPLAATDPDPADEAINVAITANLSWTSGGGIVDGYKVFLGTDTPPTNIENGTIQTALTYDPDDFSYGITYYWQIVPYNTNGDAVDCPIWSFTTLDDPTVTTYPYNQNFDAVTPPDLPLGWTAINANNDAYTWETYAGNYQSSPNCARMRFNLNMAMNDWLVMPPMQLTQDTYYKVRFYYRGGSTEFGEKLALHWGTAANPDSMTNQIFVNENVNNITYAVGEGVMQAPADGVYHFGFKGYSDADLFYIYLDTVSIDVWVEQLNPPTDLAATVDGNDVHLTWSPPLPSRALLGYKVYRNGDLIATIDDPDSLAYDDIGLTSGFYSYGVSAVYTSGESVQAGPVLADVDPVILPPANLTATVVDRDITLDWENPEGDWITWCNMNLGNSVGTGAAIVFDVAHRWTQDDLAPYAGRSISRIEFVPVYSSCVYTVKIWTGGSATDAGTLVHSQVVSNPVMNDWNTVILTAHIPIPTTGDLYYGYEVDTSGGYPAGCDDGPPIEGKGNMMYFQGSWQTLTQVAPDLTYNWSLRAFAQFAPPDREALLEPIVELREYAPVNAPLVLHHYTPEENNRLISGYKVYRDGVLLAHLDDEESVSYTDAGLPNATYLYEVTSVAASGESDPAEIEVELNFQLAELVFSDGFEDHPDFATTFAPWTLIDQDHSPTYGMTGIDFPGSGGEMAYIIFNPSATTPPLADVPTHGGDKMAASFAATTPPNNDFLVTPHIALGDNSAIKFFARSHTDAYGLERFRVGVSTLPMIVVQGFTYINDGDYVEAPTQWHEYVYDISAYDSTQVFIAIRCVSNDAFVLYIDDFSVHSDGGSIVAGDDPAAPGLVTQLKGNYPNPFNPETTIRYSLAEPGPVKIEIYNIRGQHVKSLVNESKAAGNHSVVFDGTDDSGRRISSGVYFYRMKAGNFDS